MFKKILAGILLLIILAVSGFLGWKYIAYRKDTDPHKNFLKPRIEMAVLELTRVTDDSLLLHAKLYVKNNLPFTIQVDSFNYHTLIHGSEILKSTYKESLTLKGNDTTWISLDLTAYPSDVDSILKSLEKEKIDSTEYVFEASFFTDLIFYKK